MRLLGAVIVCLVAHYSANALPQRGVQLGGGPRPVTYANPQGQVSSSFSQQLSFGPSDAGRGSPAYRSPAPILLQQGSPVGPTASPQSFPSFPSPTPFPSRGGPLRGTPASAEEEYDEEYEDDEPLKPVIPQGRPVQRAPQPVRGQSIGFSQQGPPRLVVPQSQPQQQAPVRQRQPVPQRQQPQAPQFASPQQQPQRAPSGQQPSRGQQQGQSFGIDGQRRRLTTPPPIQTVNRYMKNNEDGSITWGYENEDGTFKEETIGADCVVRGKYGYVDPEGQKREYEYQSGNPCDPNKKDQEEEEEEAEREGPGPQQQLQGVINARPRPVQQQQQRRPIPVQQQQQYQPQFA